MSNLDTTTSIESSLKEFLDHVITCYYDII